MPAVSASAPAKTILLGEHAVVYNRPAIAVPLPDIRVHVVVRARPAANPGRVWIDAADVNLTAEVDELPLNHPFRTVLHGVEAHLGRSLPACNVRIRSSIPVAAGLGSSAAAAVALIRGLSTFCGLALTDAQINDLAYAVETQQHGTPSGIDNTVVTYNRPIYFRRSSPFELLQVKKDFILVVADTGVPSSTAEAVAGVRLRWQGQPARYEDLFDQIGQLVDRGRAALAAGDLELLGRLMSRNQHYLQELGVSSPELERLVTSACQAGAMGAKLSGGGMGGNMIALVSPEQEVFVSDALLQNGAVQVLTARVPASYES